MLKLSSFDTYKKELLDLGYSPAKIQSSEFNTTLDILAKSGIPNSRHEEWKYFPLHTLLAPEYLLAPKSKDQYSPTDFAPFIQDAVHLIVVNGQLINVQELQSIPGITISINEKAISHGDDNSRTNPFPLLNSLLFHEEISISFDSSYSNEHPIHVLHIISGNPELPLLASPALSISAHNGVSATIIESFHVREVKNGLINASVLIHAESDSKLHHVIIEDGLKDIVLLYTCHSKVQGNGKVQDHVIVHDSHSVRNTITGSLQQEYATYNVYGIVSGHEKSVIDNHTTVDHIAPHCESNELFKHVLADSSTAVFNGKIFVQRDAQKTNAYQSNRTLLLSPSATINTKPQLEIFADDVKCSHGATTGSVDEEALNYLRARGISKEVALKLLTEAFIGEVVQLLENDTLREYFEGSILLESGN